MTGLDLLNHPLLDQILPNAKRGNNSQYRGRYVDLNDVHVWEDFWSMEEISFWERDERVKAVLTRALTEEERCYCTTKSLPLKQRMHNEMCFERLSESLRQQVNFLLWLCAKEIQKTDVPSVMQIGDGECARWISPDAEVDAYRKKPDYAGYVHSLSLETAHDLSGEIFNRIPGDAKLSHKINHSMLPPNGSRYRKKGKNIEARKVLSQLNCYMDRHEARYGYILTDQELICVRRRESGWGHLDVAPPVAHIAVPNAVTGAAKPNSKHLLFYLHWMVANDECPSSGWRLPAFGKSESRKRPAANPVYTSPSNLRALSKKRTLMGQARLERGTTSHLLLEEVIGKSLSWLRGMWQDARVRTELQNQSSCTTIM